MASLAESKARDLTWEFPEHESEPFRLRDERGEAGRLEFHEEPEASIAEFAGQTWTFHYTTKLRPHVRIYRGDSQDLAAEYVPVLRGGGVVTFQSGARYRWKKTAMFGDKWCFRTEEQSSSVCVRQEAGALRQGGKVSICCGAEDLPETPVLLLLAWFLRILDFEMLAEGIFRVG